MKDKVQEVGYRSAEDNDEFQNGQVAIKMNGSQNGIESEKHIYKKKFTLGQMFCLGKGKKGKNGSEQVSEIKHYFKN